MALKKGNLVDVIVDKVQDEASGTVTNLVARFKVLDLDDKRDIYLMQIIEVRREKGVSGAGSEKS